MLSSSLKSHTVLNLIIRSGAVYAQILSVDKKGRQQVLDSEVQHVFFEEVKSSEKYMHKISATIESAVTHITERLQKSKNPNVDYVAVYYSSPWFTSDLKEFDVTSSKGSTTFTKDTMKKVLLESSKELKEEYAHNGDLKPIEQHISNVNLNGYDVVHSYGKEYLTGVVTILTTWVPRLFQENIVQLLETLLHHKKVLHFSFPYTLITTLQYNTYTRFCILDVHSEITDVIFMKDNIVESIQSVPVGTNHLLSAMNHGPFETHKEKKDFLLMMTKKYIDIQEAESHKNVCESEVLRWYESLMNIPHFKMTQDYIILAEQPFQYLFEECLSREKNMQSHKKKEETSEEEYALRQTALFWAKYTKTHPEHLHRLQK